MGGGGWGGVDPEDYYQFPPFPFFFFYALVVMRSNGCYDNKLGNR